VVQDDDLAIILRQPPKGFGQEHGLLAADGLLARRAARGNETLIQNPR
jgi:hypothetical protein